MKYSLLIWGSLTITMCFYYFVLCITLLFWFVVQYKYPCLLVYMYYRKHALCTTWFLNSPLATVNQNPVHQTTIIRPGILGPECYRKSTLTTFNLVEMDFAYLGKMIARKDNQKLSLKSKKPWKKKRLKVSYPRMLRNGKPASDF